MTERLTEVEARRASVQDLSAVTDAMRALAGVWLQQALGLLGGARAYAAVIERALGQALALTDAGAEGRPVNGGKNGEGRPVLLLFAPEHGFVGAFAERLVEAALAAPKDHALWVVGSRGAALLEERGRAADWAAPMATRADGVSATARAAAEALYKAAAAHRVGPVSLLFGQTVGGAPPEIRRETLLPLDPARFPQPTPGGSPPLTNLPPAALVNRLIDEYVFARLAGAAMESFAAENAARLAVMLTVQSNIEATLEDLTSVTRRLRQEDVTSELIELATGAEALGGARRRSGQR
jgi:F-type H+-transporting ATPase subunit gamma